MWCSLSLPPVPWVVTTPYVLDIPCIPRNTLASCLPAAVYCAKSSHTPAAQCKCLCVLDSAPELGQSQLITRGQWSSPGGPWPLTNIMFPPILTLAPEILPHFEHSLSFFLADSSSWESPQNEITMGWYCYKPDLLMIKSLPYFLKQCESHSIPHSSYVISPYNIHEKYCKRQGQNIYSRESWHCYRKV